MDMRYVIELHCVGQQNNTHFIAYNNRRCGFKATRAYTTKSTRAKKADIFRQLIPNARTMSVYNFLAVYVYFGFGFSFSLFVVRCRFNFFSPLVTSISQANIYFQFIVLITVV